MGQLLSQARGTATEWCWVDRNISQAGPGAFAYCYAKNIAMQRGVTKIRALKEPQTSSERTKAERFSPEIGPLFLLSAAH